jgi:hypothetical protein
MAIHFNHTILSARDDRASATFLAEMLGLPAPTRWGPFHLCAMVCHPAPGKVLFRGTDA